MSGILMSLITFVYFRIVKMNKDASLQHAFWRNGGSNPAEIDVRTRTEVARLTCDESRRCAKPPSVCVARITTGFLAVVLF